MQMSEEERMSVVRLAQQILSKKSPRRITITQEDIEAFDFLWGMYIADHEASSEGWMSEDDQKKISKLYRKMHGKQ